MPGALNVLAQIGQPADGGGGPPGWWVAFFVIVVILAIGASIARTSWVRDMAKRRGLDPDDAAKAAFYGGDLGLAATYLKGDEPSAGQDVPARPAAERLAELADLRTQGLISDEEFAQRRQEIIDSI